MSSDNTMNPNLDSSGATGNARDSNNSVKNFIRGLTDPKTDYSNLPLFVFDIILLPITLIRLLLIYLFGSRYSIKGFRFLDVAMHADKPGFNKSEIGQTIHTIGDDYRVVIRDDSRLYPYDITENAHLLHVQNESGRSDVNNTERKSSQRPLQRTVKRTDNRPDQVRQERDIINNASHDVVAKTKPDPKSIWQTSTEDHIDPNDRPFRTDNDESNDESDDEFVRENNDVIDKTGNDETNMRADEAPEMSEDSESLDVVDEVNRAVQNIDSRIDLDDSDNSDNSDNSDDSDEEDSDMGMTQVTDMTNDAETDNDLMRNRKFHIDSDSDDDLDSDSDEDSEMKAEKKMDPVDILLQRAKARRMGKKRIFSDDSDARTDTDRETETNETSERTGSIIDNLESAFEK